MEIARDENSGWDWTLTTSPEKKRETALAVYGAEDVLVEVFRSWEDEIGEKEAAAFVDDALAKSGWEGNPPKLAFDLRPQDGRAGHTVGDVIHLVPESSGRLGRMLLLHELSHYVAPQAGHGPNFCRVYVDLVATMLGREVAAELVERLEAHGATIADPLVETRE